MKPEPNSAAWPQGSRSPLAEGQLTDAEALWQASSPGRAWKHLGTCCPLELPAGSVLDGRARGVYLSVPPSPGLSLLGRDSWGDRSLRKRGSLRHSYPSLQFLFTIIWPNIGNDVSCCKVFSTKPESPVCSWELLQMAFYRVLRPRRPGDVCTEV